MKNNFYYVLYDNLENKYVKNFNLFAVEYTDDLLFAFQFLDLYCLKSLISSALFGFNLAGRYSPRKVTLRESKIICKI